MASINLTPKQQKFAQEYIATGNATKAYKLAYDTSCMKPTTINRKAKECLDHGKISATITQLRSAMAKRAQIDQDLLTKEYARIAFLDFRIFFDDLGQLIPVSELSDDAAAALAGLETVITGSGDQVEYLKKIKTYDKLKALRDLGKHLGFFKEDNNQQSLPVVILHDPGGEERE
jgi:phage terminase small subunit